MISAGRPWPLGAHADALGVNFAVFSAHASRVELCLYAADGRTETARLDLPARSGEIWHGHVGALAAGQLYGLRAHGPWRPERGQRFNAAKLLLDPCAREIVGPGLLPGAAAAPGAAELSLELRRGPSPHYGVDAEHPQHPDSRDNGATALKARVVADTFDWQGDRPPTTALADSVIYEAHVRGLTRCLDAIPPALRGTYAGLASAPAVAHLQRLGITAISLLPVQQVQHEPRLAELGLSNYWGYNTLGWFCPEPRYAAAADGRGVRDEFRRMVRQLHAAGIEVLLDVVYNHSPEGDERGPTLSWRGLDNRSWYRLDDAAPQHHVNWTGCGNTIDIRHPQVLRHVLDSLRHWVQDFHVDGFRFDLAPVLGRGDSGFERDGAFFKAVLQDPVLQRVKLIAEPWDIGPGGYQLGQFPRGWLEWNDRFRDTARAFWLGGDCSRGEFALRLAGSSDLYQARRRSPLESINYIVSHDGFTLADLVSYDLRHNHANGEDNRDGHGHNLSWNCGHEGPTDDPEVLARRQRLQRALLATLLLSQGTPMLAAGAELGHSQGGNNNPYCQDNASSWIDWASADQALIGYTAYLLALRRELLPLGSRWFDGLQGARGLQDLAWLRRTGEPMSAEFWNNRSSRILGALIGRAERGGQPLLLLINGRDIDTTFVLPAGTWHGLLDSSRSDGSNGWRPQDGAVYPLPARSLSLLRCAASAAHHPHPTRT